MYLLDLLELELYSVVSHVVGGGKQTQSSTMAAGRQPLSHISSSAMAISNVVSSIRLMLD